MTILVIGKSGQLARTLKEVGAAQTDHNVVCVGRPDVDLCEPDTLRTALDATNPDVVINAAAYTAVDQAETDRERAFALNADGAEAVARCCASRQLPLIHISTDYVFDGRKTSAYVETDPTKPLGVYGASKLEGERRIASACTSHLILRTAWVYSPFQNNFVTTMLRLAHDRDEISVVDDQVGSPTFAHDLARAILAICTVLRRNGGDAHWGIFHAAGTGAVSWCALAREVFRASHLRGGPSARVIPIRSQDYKTAAARPNNSHLDCTKLAQGYGITLPDWRDGVAACLQQLLPENLTGTQPTNQGSTA